MATSRSPATLQARGLLACRALTRGWSLEMGKKRRLKLSATRTACRGGGGSSSAPWGPPPPAPPPRLFARPAAAPGSAAVVAIFFPRSRDFRGEADTARSRGQKGLVVETRRCDRRERKDCACAHPGGGLAPALGPSRGVASCAGSARTGWCVRRGGVGFRGSLSRSESASVGVDELRWIHAEGTCGGREGACSFPVRSVLKL